MRVGPQYQAVVPDFDPGKSFINFLEAVTFPPPSPSPSIDLDPLPMSGVRGGGYPPPGLRSWGGVSKNNPPLIPVPNTQSKNKDSPPLPSTRTVDKRSLDAFQRALCRQGGTGKLAGLEKAGDGSWVVFFFFFLSFFSSFSFFFFLFLPPSWTHVPVGSVAGVELEGIKL